MNEYAFVFPLTFILAAMIAYVVHQNHWKLTELF